VADAFKPDTQLTINEIRPGYFSKPTLTPEKAALLAAYKALTDGQQRIVEDTLRKQGFIRGVDVIQARSLQVQNLQSDPTLRGDPYLDRELV